MSALPVLLSADAEADLEQIQEYGVANGFGDPVAFTRELRARLLHLGDHPRAGRVGRIEDTREWVLTGTPFISVYELIGEPPSAVGILNILHGAMQWPPARPPQKRGQ